MLYQCVDLGREGGPIELDVLNLSQFLRVELRVDDCFLRGEMTFLPWALLPILFSLLVAFIVNLELLRVDSNVVKARCLECFLTHWTVVVSFEPHHHTLLAELVTTDCQNTD